MLSQTSSVSSATIPSTSAVSNALVSGSTNCCSAADLDGGVGSRSPDSCFRRSSVGRLQPGWRRAPRRPPEPPAVAIARAHVEAWSNHDFAAARNGLAPDVRVTATTTQPFPPATDLTGVDNYMVGLTQFAQAVVPG